MKSIDVLMFVLGFCSAIWIGLIIISIIEKPNKKVEGSKRNMERKVLFKVTEEEQQELEDLGIVEQSYNETIDNLVNKKAKIVEQKAAWWKKIEAEHPDKVTEKMQLDALTGEVLDTTVK